VRSLEAEERQAYLDSACQQDPALRREVTRLLGGVPPETHREPGQIVEPPFDGDSRPATPSKYVVGEMHVRGGLGSVWVARDKSLGRDVALKELLPELANDPEAQQRFLREAQITGQLEHPNIVPVYELSDSGPQGRPYYTMKFLRGATLRGAIAAHHRSPSESSQRELRRLLSSFTGICNAVAYAHSRGVVHRDLKPDNVMLGDFGELILLDWGLAKILSEPRPEESRPVVAEQDPIKTRRGSIMGTPAYMAPEQARGDSGDVGVRTDVYGLGAILFEILTGRPPHAGDDSEQTLNSILAGDVRRPRDVLSNVPAGLDAICAKAMAADVESRYPSATAVAADVERWLADEQVTAHRDPVGVQLLRWGRRHRKWVYGVAGALVAVTVASGVFALRFGQMAETERALRHRAMRGEAQFAARTVAGEISLRWRILETAAADPRLAPWLRALATETEFETSPQAAQLSEWLQREYARHRGTTKPASWFVTGASGIQLARSPLSDKTRGRDFSYRDYFHGHGVDLVPGSQAGREYGPIRDVHRSIVFRSEATGRLMVAFSVPVRATDGAVVGILAMTVEAGAFGVLQHGIDSHQVAVLVETGVDAQGRSGLVLHHPELAARMRAGVASAAPVYLAESALEHLSRLRLVALQRDQARARLSWQEELALTEPPLPEAFVATWQDPIGGAYSGRWLAAFEPVIIRGRQYDARDTGWVVVIQERP